jgi:hypothetical protein
MTTMMRCPGGPRCRPPNPVDPCSSLPTAEAGRPPPTGDAIAATAGVLLDRHALLAMAKATSVGYIPYSPCYLLCGTIPPFLLLVSWRLA